MTDTDGVFLEEDLIQINKFSHLHNGKTIIFCKTDFILEEFDKIRKIENDVTLITGNSDYCVTDELLKVAPKNIRTWFCQNKMTNDSRVKSIPIGLENTVKCSKSGHGYIWDHALPKLSQLMKVSSDTVPSKLVYSNFNINTNTQLRSFVQSLCDKSRFITWDDPSMPYDKYMQSLLNHSMVVCPEGNGPDTHRFWETLYLGRTPIARLSKATEDFIDLPVVWLDSWDQLSDKEFILESFNNTKHKSKKLCFSSYWSNLIINQSEVKRII